MSPAYILPARVRKKHPAEGSKQADREPTKSVNLYSCPIRLSLCTVEIACSRPFLPLLPFITNFIFFQVDGRYVVKSGSDFQNASVVTLNLHEDKSLNCVDIEEITLDSTVPEDYNMKLIISSYLGD